MKQLLRFYSCKTAISNSKNKDCTTDYRIEESSSVKNYFSCKNRLRQPFSFVIKYFMASSNPRGMKFKTRFFKNHHDKNQACSIDQNSTNKTQKNNNPKLNYQKHIIQLTEQYLQQLKSSQCFENQDQSLQEFSLDLKQKSLFVNKEHLNQQENIEESFNWVEKLVYDQQKKLVEDTSTGNKNDSSQNIQAQKVIDHEPKILIATRFDTELPKNVLIENSRKFLQYSFHLLNDYQQLRLMNEIKQFVKKIEYLNNNCMRKEEVSSDTKQKQIRHMRSQTKKIRQQKKNQQKLFFKSIRKLFCQCIVDPQLINKLLILLSKSDPKILKIQDIDKFIYKHDERTPVTNQKHRAQLEVIFKNLYGYLQNNDESHASIEQINKSICAKMEFLQQIQKNNAKKTVQKDKHQQDEQQDLTNVFQQFSKEQEQKNKKDRQTTSSNETFAKQKEFKLLLKKTSLQPHQQFQIKQSSLNEIDRVLFKNTKIVQDKIILKKEKKDLKHLTSQEKQVEQQKMKFGQNWVYAYELPYALTTQEAQSIVEYISNKWGQITQLYVYPYKNFLQKKQNQVIFVELTQKERRQQEKALTNQEIKQIKKQIMTDKLLQKINKQKYFKLNKTSMVFRFKNLEDKKQFLSKQLRLYGLNLNLYRNIRFQQAQSKTILALSMIPWGCSSTELIKAINNGLKSINIKVTYQKCIIAKGYIFIQLDSFYQTLKSRDLLNNLVFQGQKLKAQINYGSSKIYNQKYKGNLQMDHYDTLVSKLKQINCFYNDYYK